MKKATGEDFKKLRSELGLSQKGLAEMLKIPLGTIASWERRKEELSAAANYVYKDFLKKSEILRAERKKLLS